MSEEQNHRDALQDATMDSLVRAKLKKELSESLGRNATEKEVDIAIHKEGLRHLYEKFLKDNTKRPSIKASLVRGV